MTGYPGYYPLQSDRIIIPVLAGYGLAFAAVPLTWWAVGPFDSGPDHDVGPFRVPLLLLYGLGILGAVTAAAALGTIVASSRAARLSGIAGLSLTTTVLLLATGSLTAAGGRVLTAGGYGANIGAGFVLLVGPLIVAGLLVTAVFTQSAYRHIPPLRLAALVTFAAAVAPAFWAGLFALI